MFQNNSKILKINKFPRFPIFPYYFRTGPRRRVPLPTGEATTRAAARPTRQPPWAATHEGLRGAGGAPLRARRERPAGESEKK